ncbi:MAG: hypothetical protein GC147_06670 [Porphyrobacter sp.]|nr:hypothetical protein [Porphyrobacter sp.]
MTILRKIGFIAAIAALPGILAGPLTARSPHLGPGHGPQVSAPLAGAGPPGAAMMPTPAPVPAQEPGRTREVQAAPPANVENLPATGGAAFVARPEAAAPLAETTQSAACVGAGRPAHRRSGAGRLPPPEAPDPAPAQDSAPVHAVALADPLSSAGRTRPIAVSPAAPVANPEVQAATPRAASLPVTAPKQEFAQQQQQNLDFRPGTQTFPGDPDQPAFTSDDELILQLRIKGIDASDTVVAYGTRDAVYLPLGELARILDLAIRVSDDGHYANGWFLDESRTLTVNLREGRLVTAGGERPLAPGEAQAFDGEMYLRREVFEEIFPLEVKANLRAQALYLATREPFPFEERMRREAERLRLGARDARPDQERWPRQDTPWLAASAPLADVELRAVSDSPLGARLEGDLRLGADLAFMTAQTYFSATTRDGLVASLIQMGRRNAEAGLLGPLDATDFQFGDVATASMPLGLRGQAGRGVTLTNRPFQSASVFERIDLRGILPNGYEVELYRNDILVGSVARAVNDQYEFLEVPVDYGLNVFRLVFYGPQGQRREEVRRITVGDGRLAKGRFEYDAGIVQRGENLLGVRGPNFNPLEGFGSWQATAQFAYGITSGLTAVSSLAWFQDPQGADLSVATAGLRTGMGALALRADGALGSDGSSALGAGLGGRALGGSFSLSHFEYGGGFRDEIRSNSRDPLRRATEFEFNGSVKLSGQSFPLAARLRRIAFADGRTDIDAAFRTSFRLKGAVLSNTLEYSRDAAPGGARFSQLIGNFDLATFQRSRVQLRASVGYSLLQGPEITDGSMQVAYQVDDRTLISGQAFHSFRTGETGFGVSAVREFDRFTLALDGNYAFEQRSYAIALRFGFSFGRDPLRRQTFFAPPGQASSGAVAVRAFQDMDGDGRFGPADTPLEGVTFSAFNGTATTDAQGMARLMRLGNGNPAAVQVDPSTLPDILMAPASRGLEIVPRAGRIHVMDFPIVALSEVEGTVTLEAQGSARGVSGLRLVLVDAKGEIAGTARTERGGGYLFEQVKPGRYRLALEPEQAGRLGICMVANPAITVGPTSDVLVQDAVVRECS